MYSYRKSMFGYASRTILDSSVSTRMCRLHAGLQLRSCCNKFCRSNRDLFTHRLCFWLISRDCAGSALKKSLEQMMKALPLQCSSNEKNTLKAKTSELQSICETASERFSWSFRPKVDLSLPVNPFLSDALWSKLGNQNNLETSGFIHQTFIYCIIE